MTALRGQRVELLHEHKSEARVRHEMGEQRGRPEDRAAGSVIDTRVSEDQVLARITRTIVDGLRPRRIVLFGSRARGNAAPDSDYDIMVEMETDLRSSERIGAVADLFPRRGWSMD